MLQIEGVEDDRHLYGRMESMSSRAWRQTIIHRFFAGSKFFIIVDDGWNGLPELLSA
jgi:hypothetical protein